MVGEDLFDVEEEEFIPEIFLHDKALQEVEENVRREVLTHNESRFKRLGISMCYISSLEELDKKIIELLEDQRYASNR